jgi:hypothetical protein
MEPGEVARVRVAAAREAMARRLDVLLLGSGRNLSYFSSYPTVGRTGVRPWLVDPGRFADTATYDDPVRYPEGVRVVVGGRTVWDQRGPTGETPGGVMARRSG